MSVLELRIEAALEKPLCVKPDYVRFEHGSITEVFCKVCGVTIRKMIPVDEQPEVQRIGNQTIVRERVALMSLPNYREARILCDDGSAHVTPVCVDCAGKLDQDGIREECYSLDLQQWGREGLVSEKLAIRNPESVDEVAGVIE
jgi:hypothetical protein